MIPYEIYAAAGILAAASLLALWFALYCVRTALDD